MRKLRPLLVQLILYRLRTNWTEQMITLGGDAELELVDSLDPFSEGVVFSVRPPKKSWKNIANLSGGEKVCISILTLQAMPMLHFFLHFFHNWFQTLSSLALVFALHHYKPTPLYVMDEIDAALGTFFGKIINVFPFSFFSKFHLFKYSLWYTLQISRMFPLLDITSRIGQRMHSL